MYTKKNKTRKKFDIEEIRNEDLKKVMKLSMKNCKNHEAIFISVNAYTINESDKKQQH